MGRWIVIFFDISYEEFKEKYEFYSKNYRISIEITTNNEVAQPKWNRVYSKPLWVAVSFV